MEEQYLKIKSQLIIRGMLDGYQVKILPIGDKFLVLMYDNTPNITTNKLMTKDQLTTLLDASKLDDNIKSPKQQNLKEFLKYKA